jgi:hypothetical protein
VIGAVVSKGKERKSSDLKIIIMTCHLKALGSTYLIFALFHFRNKGVFNHKLPEFYLTCWTPYIYF